MRMLLPLLLANTMEATPAADAGPLLRFGYSEACPHMCPEGERQGFTTDIVRSIYQRRGYRVQFVALPWARAAADALSGELDGVLSAGKAETPQLLFPRAEIATQQDCFIGRAGDPWQAGDLASFVGRRTIVFSGWVHEGAFREALGNERYRQQFMHFSIDARYPQRVTDMVKRHRADAFWMDINVYAWYRKTRPELMNDQLRNMGCVSAQPLYLALSPARPERARHLGDTFDAGMAELRASGELKQILSAYGLADWR